MVVVIGACIAPSGALAQSVELSAEDGAHCGEVVEEAAHDVSGGCEVGVGSTVNWSTFIHNGITEALTTSCESELVANLDEDGVGYVDTSDTTIHVNVGGCPIVVCDEPKTSAEPHSEIEWPVNGISEVGGGQEVMEMTFCIRPFNTAEGVFSTCTMDFDVAQDPATHVLTISVAGRACRENPAAELTAQWQTSGPNEVEIAHPHYPADYGG